MSTFIDFVPGNVTAFSFQFTANGVPYIATVPWVLYAQRYHLSITDLSGNQILWRGLVSSGPRYTAALNWANGTAVATVQGLHSVPIGQCANIRVSQTGTSFDGEFTALSINLTSLSYALAPAPSASLPQSGTVGFDMNLLDGVTLSDGTPVGSFLLFHWDTQQFEWESAPSG